ncbi:hypothetical protein [Halanaeroarchaeum sp. HSR-CO]|uniref:hypothetical protein n=1 Tax=Halanaeroarchaeum sp. HSR-CO TaxID=2866382 RepID=UPI00217CC75F|nr:hypothetical protein [Halanaeroarchaeum sp. HSR-CO]
MSETHRSTERFDPGTHLLDSGTLVEDGADPAVSTPVRHRWERKLAAFQGATMDSDRLHQALASLLETTAEAVEVTPVEESERVSVLQDGVLVGQWVSLAALLADVTASAVLAETDDQWDAFAPATRGHILSTLRIYVPSCPICGSGVTLQTGGCQCGCEGTDDYSFACSNDECSARIYRIDKKTADAFL